MEKLQIGMIEDSVLEGIFGLKTKKLTVGLRNCIDYKPKLFNFFKQ
jgi:hypothetical protein